MKCEKYTDLFGEEHYESKRFEVADNPWDHWLDMPHFDVHDSERYMELEVEFEDQAAVDKFSALTGLSFTPQTKSSWYPESPYEKVKKFWVDGGSFLKENFPRYPIYIVSKGRWEVRPTSDSFVRMGIPHYIVVEEHQVDEYRTRVDPNLVTILTLDKKFLDEYDTFDNLGSSRSKGPGAARNFAWDHSIKLGFERHWVFDDNQDWFFRHDADKRIRCLSPAIFRAMEDHTERYENVLISGPNYRFLVPPKNGRPPMVLNTRIYSSLLIKNDIPYRWRGRYNEDTDLSLRVLKDGHCTIQYNAFTTGKMATQVMAGGNTAEFYAKEGTLPKSQMLKDMHPDVAEVVWMNNRWHHYVRYQDFKKNRLKFRPNYSINSNPEYGMILRDVL